MRTELVQADIAPEVVRVCETFSARGYAAYVVGGGVRDLLTGRGAKDWDIATDATPEQVMRLFPRTFPTGIKHGTVTVMAGEMALEVTTFRGEVGYSDGRHPDAVNFVRTIEEDLARRDFTMNAIAFDPLRQLLVDPFGGREDIAARLIKAVGEPVLRFREDGLRTLRAVRFAAVLEFDVDPATFAAISEALDVFRRVSQERVRDEICKILTAKVPSRGLSLLAKSGLLAEISAELSAMVGVVQNRYHALDVWEHTLATVDATIPELTTRMAALLHDVGKPITQAPKQDAPGEYSFFRHDVVGAEIADRLLRKWKWSNRERERVVALVMNHMFWYTPEWTDATVRRFVKRVGVDLVQELFALRAGDVVGRARGEDPESELGALRGRVNAVLEEDAALSVKDLKIDGKAVMKLLGIPPSRRIGEILERLLERVIEEPDLNSEEKLRDLVLELGRD